MNEYHFILNHFERRLDCTYASFYGPVFYAKDLVDRRINVDAQTQDFSQKGVMINFENMNYKLYIYYIF